MSGQNEIEWARTWAEALKARLEFMDLASGRRCMATMWSGAPWLCWKHPDGQWVSWRKLTQDDKRRVEAVWKHEGL